MHFLNRSKQTKLLRRIEKDVLIGITEIPANGLKPVVAEAAAVGSLKAKPVAGADADETTGALNVKPEV